MLVLADFVICPQMHSDENILIFVHLIFIMDWIILILAGLCETGFAFCLGKGNLATGNKAVLWYTAFAAICVLSMVLLTKAAKTIPLGTAYPVWTGIGAVGTVLVGILVFKEPASFWRLFFIFTLIASVVGLKTVH